MASRLTLETKLKEILGSKKVYYEPPENYRISYPCFIYSLTDVDRKAADNIGYALKNEYQITWIGVIPDEEVMKKLLQLPYCSFDRSYKSDNLNHYIYNIYW